jgi:hypothetical protein
VKGIVELPGKILDSVQRSVNDWSNFWQVQTQGNNCLPAAMSMMYSDWDRGAHTRDLNYFNRVAGIRDRETGYRGSAGDIASELHSVMPNMHTQVIENASRKQIGDALDRQLSQGHTLIAGIASPYTAGNNHYIYIAGKDNHGNYIIGDSGNRLGGKLGKTISRDDLLSRVMNRHGGTRMVAGWTDAPTTASRVRGSAAERYAQAQDSQHIADK